MPEEPTTTAENDIETEVAEQPEAATAEQAAQQAAAKVDGAKGKGPRRIGLLRQPPRRKPKRRGRPAGKGSRIESAKAEAATADAHAEALAQPGPKLPVPAFAPPLVEEHDPTPSATFWPERLKLMFKRNGIMIEDFGMNASAFNRYVTQAEQGDDGAQEKIEPVRQGLLEMMGRDLHMRKTQIRDLKNPDRLTYKTIKDPKNPAREIIEEKVRSRWGVRPDDIVGHRGKQPKPGAWYDAVYDHFYAIAGMLEFLRKVPTIVKSKHVTRDVAEAIKESHRELLDVSTNPQRELWLDLLRPIIEGANTEWDGLN